MLHFVEGGECWMSKCCFVNFLFMIELLIELLRVSQRIYETPYHHYTYCFSYFLSPFVILLIVY
jgi:hypothetical protein